jgi:hypothetical protein
VAHGWWLERQLTKEGMVRVEVEVGAGVVVGVWEGGEEVAAEVG